MPQCENRPSVSIRVRLTHSYHHDVARWRGDEIDKRNREAAGRVYRERCRIEMTRYEVLVIVPLNNFDQKRPSEGQSIMQLAFEDCAVRAERASKLSVEIPEHR